MDDAQLGPRGLLAGILVATLFSKNNQPIDRGVLLDGAPTGRSTFEKIPVAEGDYSVSLADTSDCYPPEVIVSVRSGSHSRAEFRQG